MDLTKRFNKNLDKIEVSMIRQFDQSISSIPGVLRLTLGEPDFTTPNHVKEAAKAAIDADQSHYTGMSGLLELRQAASEFVKEKYNLGDEIIFILGGYSLAGLFSLWSAYKSNTFPGIAAASPSVWFNGWEEFMNNNTPLSNTIYLSLGDTEEKTKNKVMSAVGDNIRKQEELLKNDNINTILEWNKGGHFSNSDLRVAKAFVWCIENSC